MRIFVTGPGRCGTVTFATACAVGITNYSSAHESRRSTSAPWDYPDGHIEVDPRLTWQVHGLLRRYPDALWVVLDRNREDTARSWAQWPDTMAAWTRLSTYAAPEGADPELAAAHYVRHVYWSLEAALYGPPPYGRTNPAPGTPGVMGRALWLTTPVPEVEAMAFWEAAKADGFFGAFLSTLGTLHNETRRVRSA